MALTKKKQKRCRACRTFLPSDPIDGEVWARYCPECGFPSELTPDTWTVITSGLRILVLSSLEELRSAAAARLILESDLVFPPEGSEVTVEELLQPRVTRGNEGCDGDAPQSSWNLLNPATRARRVASVSKRPALSNATVAAIDDLLRDREQNTPPLPDFRPVPLPSELRSTSANTSSSEPDTSSSEPNTATGPTSSEKRSFEEEGPSPPSEVPLSVDTASTIPASPVAKSIYGWGAVVLMAIAGLGVWLYREAKPVPVPPSPPHADLMDFKLERASVTADLVAVQALVQERLEQDPKDPKLLRRAARVANELADEQWLVERIQSGNSESSPADAKERLAQRAGEALWASERYLDATSSSEARLEKLNALRASGQIDKARTWAQTLNGPAATPAAHYALGMLALAQPGAPAAEPVRHLKSALEFDTAPGRVRAALVLAYIRAGEVEDAKKQLELLQMLTRAHPAAEPLRRLIEEKTREVAHAPRPTVPPPSRQPISYLLDEARKAARQGSTARARRLYHLVLARDADNCDATEGLETIQEVDASCSAGKD